MADDKTPITFTQAEYAAAADAIDAQAAMFEKRAKDKRTLPVLTKPLTEAAEATKTVAAKFRSAAA